MSTKKQSKITFSKLPAKEETTLTTSTDSETLDQLIVLLTHALQPCVQNLVPRYHSQQLQWKLLHRNHFSLKAWHFQNDLLVTVNALSLAAGLTSSLGCTSVEKDAALCLTCMEAERTKAMSQTKGEDAFTDVGYRNWKKAITKDGFAAHEASDAHQEAVLRCVKAPSASYGKAVTVMSGTNQRMLLKIFSNVRYLARQ